MIVRVEFSFDVVMDVAPVKTVGELGALALRIGIDEANRATPGSVESIRDVAQLPVPWRNSLPYREHNVLGPARDNRTCAQIISQAEKT